MECHLDVTEFSVCWAACVGRHMDPHRESAGTLCLMHWDDSPPALFPGPLPRLVAHHGTSEDLLMCPFLAHWFIGFVCLSWDRWDDLRSSRGDGWNSVGCRELEGLKTWQLKHILPGQGTETGEVGHHGAARAGSWAMLSAPVGADLTCIQVKILLYLPSYAKIISFRNCFIIPRLLLMRTTTLWPYVTH